MTLLEKIFNESVDRDFWFIMEKRCPVSAFTDGHLVPKICESECSTGCTGVDCPRCWTQEYKEEYGEVDIL